MKKILLLIIGLFALNNSSSFSSFLSSLFDSGATIVNEDGKYTEIGKYIDKEQAMKNGYVACHGNCFARTNEYVLVALENDSNHLTVGRVTNTDIDSNEYGIENESVYVNIGNPEKPLHLLIGHNGPVLFTRPPHYKSSNKNGKK